MMYKCCDKHACMAKCPAHVPCMWCTAGFCYPRLGHLASKTETSKLCLTQLPCVREKGAVLMLQDWRGRRPICRRCQ